MKVHYLNQLKAIIIFLCLSANVMAMENYKPQIINPMTESWRWKQFSELEGKGIRDISEDEDGKVWIAVDQGVYEYNGYDWKLHQILDSGQNPVAIEQVQVAKNGNIYAVSQHQVYLYQKDHSWKALLNSPNGHHFIFNQLRELSDGSIMIGSNDGVLHLRRDQSQIFYTSSTRIKHLKEQQLDFDWVLFPEQLIADHDFYNVSDILEDGKGKIWFAFTFEKDGKLFQFKVYRL